MRDSILDRRMLAAVMTCVLLTLIFVHGVEAGEESRFTNSIGMECVLIPAGNFMMGTAAPDCPWDDPFTEKNE